MIGFTLRIDGELFLGPKPHGARVGVVWRNADDLFAGTDFLSGKSFEARTVRGCRAMVEDSVLKSLQQVAKAMVSA